MIWQILQPEPKHNMTRFVLGRQSKPNENKYENIVILWRFCYLSGLHQGAVAKRLGSGLQIRLERFDSARRLHYFPFKIRKTATLIR